MSWSRDVLKILTLRCEEASLLASRELDQPLGLAERVALRGHSLVCRSCRRLRRQLFFLHVALQRQDVTLLEKDDEDASLSPEARARIEHVLAEAFPNGNGDGTSPEVGSSEPE